MGCSARFSFSVFLSFSLFFFLVVCVRLCVCVLSFANGIRTSILVVAAHYGKIYRIELRKIYQPIPMHTHTHKDNIRNTHAKAYANCVWYTYIRMLLFGFALCWGKSKESKNAFDIVIWDSKIYLIWSKWMML